MQPYAAVLANTIYGILVRMKICRKRVTLIDPSSDLTGVTVNVSLNHDKERRK